jgi:hypothetical protein
MRRLVSFPLICGTIKGLPEGNYVRYPPTSGFVTSTPSHLLVLNKFLQMLGNRFCH